MLVDACKTWKAAQEEVSDRITIIEHAWHRARMQLEFVENLPVTLDEEYRRILDDLARILAMRLSSATAEINRALDKESRRRPGFLDFGRRVKRAKYVLVKAAIDDAVRDVEDWQRRFDPSWFLIMRAAGPAIDEPLHKARGREQRQETVSCTAVDPEAARRPTPCTRTPFSAAESLRQALRDPTATRASVFLPSISLDKQAIPYSTFQRANLGGRSFFVESIVCPPGADLNTLTADTRKLAHRLRAVDPLAFGLLNCKGVIKVPGDDQARRRPSFTMVFRPPESLDPADGFQSLREFLLSGRNTSLSHRITMARSLARSVSSVHTFEFVHKNIRPESVLLLGGETSTTFLLGFDSFREADGATRLLGDESWDQNLYRHPTRQGKNLTSRYRMHHDVYSLGVCLLELGLGESLVSYDAQGLPHPASNMLHGFTSWLNTTGRVSTETRNRLEDLTNVQMHIKGYLEHLAATRVPQSAGTMFAEVIAACLTCLDDSAGLDDDDPYGIEVGMGFIHTILRQLDEIKV